MITEDAKEIWVGCLENKYCKVCTINMYLLVTIDMFVKNFSDSLNHKREKEESSSLLTLNKILLLRPVEIYY